MIRFRRRRNGGNKKKNSAPRKHSRTYTRRFEFYSSSSFFPFVVVVVVVIVRSYIFRFSSSFIYLYLLLLLLFIYLFCLFLCIYTHTHIRTLLQFLISEKSLSPERRGRPSSVETEVSRRRGKPIYSECNILHIYIFFFHTRAFSKILDVYRGYSNPI